MYIMVGKHLKHSFLLMATIFVSTQHSPSQQFSEAIEDNSYFIEEAFNQEDHVVQHISNGYYLSRNMDFTYSFTQEWPIGGQTHQLSFTIPYQSIHTGPSGLGDVNINYRYQLLDGNDWCWLSPRLTIILPTGKSLQGLGSGGVGAQVNLPASKRITDSFISHVNIGTTLLPNVERRITGGASVHKTLISFFTGISGIFLLTLDFNLMCELLWNSYAELDESGNISRIPETTMSPGFRYAINIANLQIVPGLAVPITSTHGQYEVNIYGYVSFEHPF